MVAAPRAVHSRTSPTLPDGHDVSVPVMPTTTSLRASMGPPWRCSRAALCASLLALAAGACVSDHDPSNVSTIAQPVAALAFTPDSDLEQYAMDPYHSVLINDRIGISAVENDPGLSLGSLLESVARAASEVTALDDPTSQGVWCKRYYPGSKCEYGSGSGPATKFPDYFDTTIPGNVDVDRWIRDFLANQEAKYEANDAHGAGAIGLIQNAANPWTRVLELWPEINDAQADAPGPGPFRLLAVVNRMDLAGDIDRRAFGPPSESRPFGEARLIFGLMDPVYESTHGRAYPMTLIMEYRLPALNTSYKPKKIHTYDYDCLDKMAVGGSAASCFVQDGSNTGWNNVMKRWTQVWWQLSKDHDQGGFGATFQQHLADIVRVFTAIPEHHVALRANVRIEKNPGAPCAASGANMCEQEIVEFYLSPNGWKLNPRFLRNTPRHCAKPPASAGENGVDDTVEYFWDPAINDVSHDPYWNNPDPVYSNVVVEDPGDRPEQPVPYNYARGFSVPKTTERFPYGDIADLSTEYSRGGIPVGCGAEQFLLISNSEHTVLAPWARVRPGWKYRRGQLGERQRHSFAMQTCDGCHSAEAGFQAGTMNFGFHVAPRLANSSSRLSRFLTGGATFVSGGTNYGYNELDKRLSYILDVYDDVITDPTRYEGMRRDDIQ